MQNTLEEFMNEVSFIPEPVDRIHILVRAAKELIEMASTISSDEGPFLGSQSIQLAHEYLDVALKQSE